MFDQRVVDLDALLLSLAVLRVVLHLHLCGKLEHPASLRPQILDRRLLLALELVRLLVAPHRFRLLNAKKLLNQTVNSLKVRLVTQ